VCLRRGGKGGLAGQDAMRLRKAVRVDREEYRRRLESSVERVPAYRFEWRGAFDNRRRGVGKRLVAAAVPRAREAGCEWLHVCFQDHLRRFYFGACGIEPTNARLIAL
jgi:GNAT superfamily N-acetyltransferase